MNKKNIYKIIALFLITFLLYSCSLILAKKEKKMLSHPKLINARFLCSECHRDIDEKISKPYELLNHTERFLKQHNIYSSQESELCEMCHHNNFCLNCHTPNDVTNFNYKNVERPDKTFPHKGDYLKQHQIDGKVFTDKCFSCHGKKNNKQCSNSICHK